MTDGAHRIAAATMHPSGIAKFSRRRRLSADVGVLLVAPPVLSMLGKQSTGARISPFHRSAHARNSPQTRSCGKRRLRPARNSGQPWLTIMNNNAVPNKDAAAGCAYVPTRPEHNGLRFGRTVLGCRVLESQNK